MVPAPLFPYLLASIALTLLLCFVWTWKRTSQKCGTQSPSSTIDSPGFEPSDGRSLGYMDQVREDLLGGQRCSATYPGPSNTVPIKGTCLAEISQPIFTSGQVAALVQQWNRRKDIEQNNIYQAPNLWISQAKPLFSSLWSNDVKGNTIKRENDSIEFYYSAEEKRIWRRRFLALAAQ